MLKEISKKDSYWREKALLICNDKMLADDLVQDMYLYIYKVKTEHPDKTFTDWYIVKKIHNLFLDICRKKNEPIPIESLFYLKDEAIKFEPTDYEQSLLDKAKELKWYKQELLEQSYDKSLREISKEYQLVDYGFIHRNLENSRRQILKEDYNKKYNNKRRKR